MYREVKIMRRIDIRHIIKGIDKRAKIALKALGNSKQGEYAERDGLRGRIFR